MSGYRYEVHLHTKQSSACGYSSGEEYVDVYKKLGITGFFVTDHFYHGNTAVDRSLPWSEWVAQYCRGYEIAKQAGDREGIDVFFAIEENFQGDEYLIYGLERDWLIAHPQMITWKQEELFAACEEAGALMVHAHPYRERNYLSAIHLHPHTVHAIEVANNGNPPYQDKLAYQYATQVCKVPITAGSDIHNAAWALEGGFYMEFDEPIHSVREYVERVKSSKGYRPIYPQERAVWDDSCVTTLPIVRH